MRVIVFLCLLGAALCQTRSYSWNGDQTPDPENDKEKRHATNSENVCLTDEASCSCCLMQQQLHRMEMFFNLSFSELQKDLDKTAKVLNDVRASRSAFSVALTNTRWCLGPFSYNSSVIYKHIFINLGDGYNVGNGIFTVPRSGVYSLSLTVFSDSGAADNKLEACASMTVNGLVVASPSDRNKQDQEDSATTVLALQLQAGDSVAVQLPIGCFLCDNESHFNTFTGFLLYATD